MDTSTWGYWHQFFIVAVVLITQALLNHYGIDLTTKVTVLSGYLIFAMIIIMPIVWYVFERNRFEGVPEGEKIVQRQKMNAEIERKYGEQ